MGKRERLDFFDELAAIIRPDRRQELLIEHLIEANHFAELRRRAAAFLSASMGLGAALDNEEGVLTGLGRSMRSMSNITPGGLVKPKRETMLEFNAMQRAYAEIVRDLGLGRFVDTWSLAINVRVVAPEVADGAVGRPYYTGKRHTDVWAHEPSDLVLLNTMVFGDAGRTTIDYFGPPDGFGDDYLVPLPNYDEGERLTPGFQRYPMELRLGGIYISDCATLHQTRREGGIRVSIDTTFRRRGTDEQKSLAARSSTSKRLTEYVPFREWMGIGLDSLLVFRDRIGDPPLHDPVLVPLP